jgi:hypothetical protein
VRCGKKTGGCLHLFAAACSYGCSNGPQPRTTSATRCLHALHPIQGSQLQRTPGLTEWIDWLRRRGVRMAAVTNAPRANTELMLAALGLDKEFEVGGANVGRWGGQMGGSSQRHLDPLLHLLLYILASHTHPQVEAICHWQTPNSRLCGQIIRRRLQTNRYPHPTRHSHIHTLSCQILQPTQHPTEPPTHPKHNRSLSWVRSALARSPTQTPTFAPWSS